MNKLKICDRVRTTDTHAEDLTNCKNFEGVIISIEQRKGGRNDAVTVLDTDGEEHYIDICWIEKVQFFTDEDIICAIKRHWVAPRKCSDKFSELNILLESLVRSLQTKFNAMGQGYEEIGVILKSYRLISNAVRRIEEDLPRETQRD